MTIQLRAADLLFIHHHSLDALSDPFATAIVKATGPYVHVALAMNDATIIHATPEAGVVLQDLASFLSERKQADVYRLADISSQAVIAQARKYLGRPYNSSFYPEDKGFYCSQLVLAAFADQIKLPEVAMSFGDGKQPISAYWQRYFDRLGLPVPLGQVGSNPDHLSTFPKLSYIGTLSDDD
ncbi:MAG: hydrolase [Streptococcaceae bacterium]|jgi:hypothetical protein|nr:hydrolase [Streptococcaceae bacterium]